MWPRTSNGGSREIELKVHDLTAASSHLASLRSPVQGLTLLSADTTLVTENRPLPSFSLSREGCGEHLAHPGPCEGSTWH